MTNCPAIRICSCNFHPTSVVNITVKGLFRYIAAVVALGISSTVFAQMPSGTPAKSNPQDSAIVFTSPRPLIDDNTIQANTFMNSWGFTGLFNDFGFGLGLYYRRNLAEDLTTTIGLDFGTGKGPNEFGSYTEIKVHRIYVMPLMANLDYRILTKVLGDAFRPYLTGGVGPVLIMTNDAQRDFFSALGHSAMDVTYGGNLGLGAYFGSDAKSSFGAAFRYYIIPYAKGVESTQGVVVTNFSGPTLSVSYGFNF
jgi:hypothetical protein